MKIDPSKHCHALKLLSDTADDCEKHVEELTWQLDDDSHSLTSKLSVVNGSRSKNKECHFPPSTSKQLDNSLSISAKTEKPQKGSPLKPKSHISGKIHSEQEVESRHFSSISKRQKLDSTSITTKVTKQIGKRSASFSKSDVEKLSSNKKLKSAEVAVKFDGHKNKKLDFDTSKVQLSGGRDRWSNEATGVVSFTDDAEINEPFPPCQKSLPSHPRQETMYSEFESAVINEFIDQEAVVNVDRHIGRRRTDHESSDEDAFDLIASGRINTLIRRSLRSECDRSEVVDVDHQTVPAEVDYDHTIRQRQTEDDETDAYDSASSADTDVIIRSQRLMSEVRANLQNQAVSTSQLNPNTALNITSRCISADGKRQRLNVDDNVSPSPNLAASRFSTEQKLKKKRSKENCSEAAVKNCDSSPSVQQLTPVIAGSILPKRSFQNCDFAEHKQQQKSSEVDDSEGRVKNSVSDAFSSPPQQSKSVSMPDIRQRKTDVSALCLVSKCRCLLLIC